MKTPVDEVRALAARALDDCRDEMQAANDAILRSNVYLDKYRELEALAARIGVVTVDGGDTEDVAYVVRPI